MKTRRSLIGLIWSTLLLANLSGCKTTAQLEQDQKVKGISSQLEDNQKLSVEMNARMQGIEQKVNRLNGKIEEMQHENLPGQKEDLQMSLKEMEERMSVIEKNLHLVRQEMEAQRNFVESVTQTLKSVGAPSKSDKGDKKKSNQNPVNSGSDSDQSSAALFKAGKYSQAKPLLEQELAGNKISGKQRSQALHNLGMIYFLDKEHDQAMVLFSKLYKEFPSSSLNRTGLLSLGKSLVQKGEKDQAKSALAMVMEKFPGTPSAKEAQKILAGIK